MSDDKDPIISRFHFSHEELEKIPAGTPIEDRPKFLMTCLTRRMDAVLFYMLNRYAPNGISFPLGLILEPPKLGIMLIGPDTLTDPNVTEISGGLPMLFNLYPVDQMTAGEASSNLLAYASDPDQALYAAEIATLREGISRLQERQHQGDASSAEVCIGIEVMGEMIKELLHQAHDVPQDQPTH